MSDFIQYDSSMNGGGEGRSLSMTILMMATIHRHRKCLTSHPERRQQRPVCVKGVIGYKLGFGSEAGLHAWSKRQPCPSDTTYHVIQLILPSLFSFSVYHF